MRTFKHFLFFICICLQFILFLACQNESQSKTIEAETAEIASDKLTSKDIASLEYTDYALSDMAISTTQNWLAFIELNKQIEILKQADLSFFKDDKAILKSTINDLKNEIPEKLNETSIEVRLISLETNLYKLEGSAILNNSKKETLINDIKDVLLSHTNLIFQINRTLEKDAQKIQKPF